MDIQQTTINKLSASQSVLILVAATSADSLAAGLAFEAFLKKLEKDVVLYSSEEVPARLGFLPQVADVRHSLDLVKTFVINVATKRAELKELSYKKNPEQLSIFLKPGSGEFTQSDVTFGSSAFPFDLVVLIGIAQLEQLGNFYERHADLFFQVPILNIDFRANNENYGQMNLVDLTATSVSEIILDLINKFEASLLDETMATQLLAGIIAETNSFQHIRTTPQTFMKASQLVSLGARQQEIITNLYKSKSMGLLKLWGRVLARLKQDFDGKLVYSAINQNDLVKSEASAEDAEAIIKEMVSQLSFAKIFVLLMEADNQTTVFCACLLPINLPAVFNELNPEVKNPQTVKFSVNKPASEVQGLVLQKLAANIPQ